MDYRCPICGVNLGKRRLSRGIVARMEIDCPRCKHTIRVNVHPAEAVAVMLSFGTIILLAVLAYWFRSRNLGLLVLAAAVMGVSISPLIERIFLRTWPRYASTDGSRSH